MLVVLANACKSKVDFKQISNNTKFTLIRVMSTDRKRTGQEKYSNDNKGKFKKNGQNLLILFRLFNMFSVYIVIYYIMFCDESQNNIFIFY